MTHVASNVPLPRKTPGTRVAAGGRDLDPTCMPGSAPRDIVSPTECVAPHTRRVIAVIGSSKNGLRLTRACTVCVILLAVRTGAAINLAGFAVPSAINTTEGVLQAASCGVRSTLWIEHYAAVLYLRPGVALDAVGNPSEPKSVLMYVSEARYLPDEIPPKWRRALERGLNERTLRHVRQAFGALSNGDLVTITYLPGEGVSMGVNGRVITSKTAHVTINDATAEELEALWGVGPHNAKRT
jgi:Chalcone isomerase-like